MANSNLTNARNAKNDEFYTILSDIEKELKLLNEKIVAVGQKIQEEQQDRTNKILGKVWMERHNKWSKNQ